MGSLLILGGIILIIIGFLVNLGFRWPVLPGDILIQREKFTFYFPVASSILISIIITAIVNLIKK
ncbi:MAG: DUF2905 domain-containing protein [Patescibacteria group bacterium]|nr:DUF2905 domain-containing protein [Patescibacteria group bacterium]